MKVMKCPPNYTTKEDENSNLILTIEITESRTLILKAGILGVDLTGHFVSFIKI